MQQIHIQSFHARYRLPSARANVLRRRLDTVLSARLEEILERAVERSDAARDPGAHVCLRHVLVPVKVRMSGSDQAIAEAWSEALAKSIRAATLNPAENAGDDDDSCPAVRYPSRVHAMIDLAASVGRHDLRRAWAWRQLGMWQISGRAPSREAVRELVRALAREPAMIVPVLRVLAGREQLQDLVGKFEADDWITVATAALTAAGSTLGWRDLQAGSSASDPLIDAKTASLAERLVGASSLRTIHVAGVPWERCLAALVILDACPVLVAEPSDQALSLVAEVQRALRTLSRDVQPDPEAIHDPVPVPSESPSTTRELPETTSRIPKDQMEEFWGEEHGAKPAKLRPASQDATSVDLRQRARTQQGGLLFLLNVLEHLGLPARIPHLIQERSHRWVLQQLALDLAPVAPDDPAVLAFAGLPPQSPPPDRDEPSASPIEKDLLSDMAEAVRKEVLLRLTPQESDAAVLSFVCARPADIIADPGWIEARFSAEHLSTDIRRAMLDLNPGYLPWLGVVVRFTYE